MGVAADPCWGSSGEAVYRVRVPTAIASGNGAYQVTLVSGLTDGRDPWVSGPVFPADEGASLVIVGTGSYDVAIYDGTSGFGPTTFYGGQTLTYTLSLPAVPTTDALWDNIGADGQAGVSRYDDPYTSLETTVINGVLIAGAGGLDNDSDWNGSAGLPIPQLWDDTGHGIFTAVDGLTTAAISFTSNNDCVTTIANVLAVK